MDNRWDEYEKAKEKVQKKIRLHTAYSLISFLVVLSGVLVPIYGILARALFPLFSGLFPVISGSIACGINIWGIIYNKINLSIAEGIKKEEEKFY